MNNSAFRYALNTSLRGLVSLDYGIASIADGTFEIVPADYSYYGQVYMVGKYINLISISYLAKLFLAHLQYHHLTGLGLAIELEQYEDLMNDE